MSCWAILPGKEQMVASPSHELFMTENNWSLTCVRQTALLVIPLSRIVRTCIYLNALLIRVIWLGNFPCRIMIGRLWSVIDPVKWISSPRFSVKTKPSTLCFYRPQKLQGNYSLMSFVKLCLVTSVGMK